MSASDFEGPEPIPFDLPETPVGWVVETVVTGMIRWRRRLTDQTVIMTCSLQQDGKRWMHFSTAFPQRIPRWDELVSAKEMFLGKEARALQVIPPRSEYVNINPSVLHLWVCLDGDVTPDFTWGTGSL